MRGWHVHRRARLEMPGEDRSSGPIESTLIATSGCPPRDPTPVGARFLTDGDPGGPRSQKSPCWSLAPQGRVGLDVAYLELLELLVRAALDVHRSCHPPVGGRRTSSSSLTCRARCSRLWVCWITNTMMRVIALETAAKAASLEAEKPGSR